MQEKILFIIGTPRSGSTLLNRMLGSNSAIHAPAEPHLMTPLAHLGYYARVDEAPYDPIIAQRGIRELVPHLPSGEADYLNALRAYTDSIYQNLLAGSGTGAHILLDKTPAYALVLDFMARLYPGARYVVLTRHPLAIWSSVVDSFYDGDSELAHAHNPILERYVPAIARFLRDAPVPIHRVRYEELVENPETQMREVCDFIGLKYESTMVNYGESSRAGPASRGLGDPTTVAKESRPTTQSVDKWTRNWTGQRQRVEQAIRILDHLDDRDLETWGYPRGQLLAELEAVDLEGSPAARPKLTRHVAERRLIMALRRRVGDNLLGRAVKRVREICDLLLR